MTARRVAIAAAVLGCVLIVTGVAFVYWPAGFITAGVLILTALFGPDLEV